MSGTPRLRLALHPSRTFAVVVVAAHAAAGACAALAMGGSAVAAFIGILLLVLGLVAAWRVALLRAPGSPVGLELAPDGVWTAQRRDGATRSGRASRRRVTPWWVSIPAGGGGLLVVRGMAAPDDFRRLRVWALWSGGGNR